MELIQKTIGSISSEQMAPFVEFVSVALLIGIIAHLTIVAIHAVNEDWKANGLHKQ